MARRRLDTVLAERGLAASRSAAATSVRAGLVRVGRDGPLAVRPSQLVDPEGELCVEEGRRYVSRGGLKLEAALDELNVTVEGRGCLDVGASTGGFTDCLLRRGAARVISLDVGRGQLDWGLRNDSRVTVLEGVNARRLDAAMLRFEPDLATIDVSFISLAKVLPAVAACLASEGEILAMVKPQFELGPERVGRSGVVRVAKDRREAVLAAAAAARDSGLLVTGLAAAGLPGAKGNRETFLRLGRGGPELTDLEAAARRVDP